MKRFDLATIGRLLSRLLVLHETDAMDALRLGKMLAVLGEDLSDEAGEEDLLRVFERVIDRLRSTRELRDHAVEQAARVRFAEEGRSAVKDDPFLSAPCGLQVRCECGTNGLRLEAVIPYNSQKTTPKRGPEAAGPMLHCTSCGRWFFVAYGVGGADFNDTIHQLVSQTGAAGCAAAADVTQLRNIVGRALEKLTTRPGRARSPSELVDAIDNAVSLLNAGFELPKKGS